MTKKKLPRVKGERILSKKDCGKPRQPVILLKLRSRVRRRKRRRGKKEQGKEPSGKAELFEKGERPRKGVRKTKSLMPSAGQPSQCAASEV